MQGVRRVVCVSAQRVVTSSPHRPACAASWIKQPGAHLDRRTHHGALLDRSDWRDLAERVLPDGVEPCVRAEAEHV